MISLLNILVVNKNFLAACEPTKITFLYICSFRNFRRIQGTARMIRYLIRTSYELVYSSELNKNLSIVSQASKWFIWCVLAEIFSWVTAPAD